MLQDRANFAKIGNKIRESDLPSPFDIDICIRGGGADDNDLCTGCCRDRHHQIEGLAEFGVSDHLSRQGLGVDTVANSAPFREILLTPSVAGRNITPNRNKGLFLLP